MNIHLFLNEILCKREIIPKTGSIQKVRFYVPHILIVKGTKMTKADMERYYFYRLYVIDFDAAKHTFEVLRRYKRNDIRFYLLRDLVMCYSRPFSGNKGENYSKLCNQTLICP